MSSEPLSKQCSEHDWVYLGCSDKLELDVFECSTCGKLDYQSYGHGD